ncbi:MAG TPA: NUDIX domain-containing protein [Acidimicrobiales bacterium]|nr:NUDIX domain-containing protein [Acidimicrobiales bacterium]
MCRDEVWSSVHEAVTTHRPVDTRESTARARMLAELERLPSPFLEEADPTHVTASALVVGPRGIVLHRHRRLGIWMQPGGHVDPGETPWQTARRETIEETGLDVTEPEDAPVLVHLDVHPAARGHTHLDLRYLLLGGDGDPRPAPGESQDVRWFSWSAATAIADEALIGALRAVRQMR